MAITTNIDSFAAPHGKKEGGGGGTTIIMSNQNNSSIPANINVNTINATTGDIQNLTGRSLTFNDGSFIYLVSENGTIAKLNGNELKYENGVISNLTSDSIETGKLKTTDLEATNATIDNIISKNITTEYLTVTKQAHFFELVIDKIKAVGGQIILTPASCIADYVIPDPDHNTPLYYDVYFRATDEVNREIINYWQVDDQAICQNFNNATQGHNYNVSNKYYWRLVTGILEDAYINFRTGQKLPYDTTEAHDYTSANIWNICLGSYDVNTGDHIDYKTDFDDDPNYPVDPGTEGYTKRALLNNVDIAPMELNHIPMAGWTSKTVAEDPMIGEMKTYNTIFGIQITPKENSNITGAILNKIELSTAEETRLNIGVYYVDDSSQYFPAPLEKTDHYVYNLNANTSIEAIIITNSDEPDWHLCHGIRLGNDNTNPNDLQVDVSYNPYSAVTPSIPEVGDNIIQLGYRYHKYDPQSPDPEIRAKYDVKRASAIIIASYHTPDIGYTGPQGQSKSGLTPPSYAQYKKIRTFELGKYRHSYFDANNAEFVGNFKVTSGNDEMDLDQYIEQNSSTNYYRIICSEDPIVKPSSGTKNINVTVLNVVGGEATIMTESDLSGWYLVIDNDTDPDNHITVTPGTNHFTIGITNSTSTIDIKLYDGNGALKDTYIAACIDLGTVTDGKNGDWTQWVYTNFPIAGYHGAQAPAISNTNSPNVMPNNPPKGWQSAPWTPTSEEYTWYSTRLISYDSNNNRTVGSFTTPARLTGANGKDGEDGGDIEFIYIRNNDNSAPTDPNTITHGQVGPQGIATNGAETNKQLNDWVPNGYSDRPMGVQSDLQYEFMSQRYKTNKTWGNFTTPSLWAKYAENGRDGDGVEYIFRLNGSAELPFADYPNYATYAGKSFTDDDFVPQGWNDDPLSPTENETYCFVSQRRQKNGEWSQSQTPWSTPAIWSRYSKDGDPGHQGPTGPQGIGGANAIAYKLVDRGSTAYSSISFDSSNTMSREVKANLVFSIAKIEGSTVSYVDIGNMTLSATFNGNGTDPISFSETEQNSKTYRGGATIAPTSNEAFADYNMIIVTLKNSSSTIIDTVEIPVTMTSAATSQIIQGQQASIVEAVTGMRGNQTSIAQLRIGIGGIQSDVIGIQTDLSNNYATTSYVESEISQQAAGITSTVKSSIKTGGTNLIMNGAFKKDLEFWNENGTDTGVTRGIATDDAGYKWAYIKAPSNSQYTGYNQSRYSNNKIIIKSGKTYTLTFRAYAVLDPEQVGATPELSTIFHWGNHILTDAYRQEHNLGIPQIGKKYQLSTSPQSYTWSFTIPDNLFNTGVGAEWFTFIFNDENGQNIKMYITDITFVEGDTPQYWSPAPEEEEEYSESRISQKADEILLQVGDCGIDIHNSRIELNGSTQINGDLSIEKADTGFVIRGPQGETHIKPTSIGTFEDFRANNTNTTSNKIQRGGYAPSYSARAYHEMALPAGKEITFSDISVSFASYPATGRGTCTYWSMQLQRRLNSDYEWTNVGTFVTNETSLTGGEWKYTTDSTEYEYQMVIDWTISNITTNVLVNTYFNFKSSYTNQLKTLIAYDGIASNLAAGTVYIGQSGTYIQYGDYGLKVTANGIYKLNGPGTSWTLANL